MTKTSHQRTNPSGDRIEVKMNPLRQLHLLHAELHGPFSPENIALGDPSMNSSMIGAEQAAISAIKDGQIRYRVDVTYHSNVRPPDNITEIPGDPVITVKNWVGFYVAKKITVVSTKWDGSAYSIGLSDIGVDGTLPAVSGEVIERAEDTCFNIAKTHLVPTQNDKVVGDKVYKATSLTLGALREEANLNPNQMKEVSKKLQRDGRIHVTTKSENGSGTIFVYLG